MNGMGKNLLKYAIPPVFWLGVWQLAAWCVRQELLLPGPAAVGRSLLALAGTTDFWLSVAATRNTLPELVRQHWEIYNLLKRHADHTAGAYMFLHIKNFGDELKQYIQEKDGNILPLSKTVL